MMNRNINFLLIVIVCSIIASKEVIAQPVSVDAFSMEAIRESEDGQFFLLKELSQKKAIVGLGGIIVPLGDSIIPPQTTGKIRGWNVYRKRVSSSMKKTKNRTSTVLTDSSATKLTARPHRMASEEQQYRAVLGKQWALGLAEAAQQAYGEQYSANPYSLMNVSAQPDPVMVVTSFLRPQSVDLWGLAFVDSSAEQGMKYEYAIAPVFADGSEGERQYRGVISLDDIPETSPEFGFMEAPQFQTITLSTQDNDSAKSTTTTSPQTMQSTDTTFMLLDLELDMVNDGRTWSVLFERRTDGGEYETLDTFHLATIQKNQIRTIGTKDKSLQEGTSVQYRITPLDYWSNRGKELELDPMLVYDKGEITNPKLEVVSKYEQWENSMKKQGRNPLTQAIDSSVWDNDIELSWNVMQGKSYFDKVIVYRSYNTDDGWDVLDTVAFTEGAIVDGEAQYNDYSFYSVQVILSNGDTLTRSARKIVFREDIRKPAPPQITDTKYNQQGATIQWSPQNEAAEYFYVYRKIDGGAWKLISEALPKDERTYLDTDMPEFLTAYDTLQFQYGVASMSFAGSVGDIAAGEPFVQSGIDTLIHEPFTPELSLYQRDDSIVVVDFGTFAATGTAVLGANVYRIGEDGKRVKINTELLTEPTVFDTLTEERIVRYEVRYVKPNGQEIDTAIVSSMYEKSQPNLTAGINSTMINTRISDAQAINDGSRSVLSWSIKGDTPEEFIIEKEQVLADNQTTFQPVATVSGIQNSHTLTRHEQDFETYRIVPRTAGQRGNSSVLVTVLPLIFDTPSSSK
jgi:hypothetical protein